MTHLLTLGSSSIMPALGMKEKINTVASLKKGIIKSREGKHRDSYTILLVGETGVGKSTFLELLGNVVAGNDAAHYDLGIVDRSNESGRSQSQSQTLRALTYRFTSKNGVQITVLDTPGLADTRGFQNDELHKASIAKEIKENIECIHAVLILANGTVPRLTVSTEYALRTLSTIFPKSLVDNIAFVFTNVPGELSWNFSQDSIPEDLRAAPRHILNNPMALRKRLNEMRLDSTDDEDIVEGVQEELEAAEKKALKMLAGLFDWLADRFPQPTKDILALYEQTTKIQSKITDAIAHMEQVAQKMVEVEALVGKIEMGKENIKALADYVTTEFRDVWKQVDTPGQYNTICTSRGCFRNCHEGCNLVFNPTVDDMKWCRAMKVLLVFPGDRCNQCGHSVHEHQHVGAAWRYVKDEQRSVNEQMKARWEAAKGEGEGNENMRQTAEEMLKVFQENIDQDMKEIARLAEEYGNLSLSGSFQAPMEKTAGMLEQRIRGLQQSGSLKNSEALQNYMDSLEKSIDMLIKSRENGMSVSAATFAA